MADVAALEDHRLAITALLETYGLRVARVPAGEAIPGSFWGESEAGLIADAAYARSDTPVHSILHESCHWICMTPHRRAGLHTDAGGDDLEECAVCYLQILLADHLPGIGRDRLMRDMDHWGYSFRLGHTQAWFESDAHDAQAALIEWGLIDPQDNPRLGVTRS